MKTKYWKVFCQEQDYPGLWPRWFKEQCVAVGWNPNHGHTLEGKLKGKGQASWRIARNALKKIQPEDMVLVQLKGNRVGRIGEVVRKRIADNEWKPTVVPSKEKPDGEKGRRIDVRWDLGVGPPDPSDTVVKLPEGSRLKGARLTISRLKQDTFLGIRKAMMDDSNWVGLHGRFDSEKALSDFIATYPHHLEDNLMPHPDKKVRENRFRDKTRSDVLLIDKSGTPVVVECKQHAPTLENIQQLRKYMKHIRELTGKGPRGILVHGGAASLREQVRKEVALDPSLKMIRYSLQVGFTSST